MKTKPSYLWHINMKYEKRSFIFLGSNMKYGNMSYFEREQKYNMKYEIWRAWAKIWNMKYENMTSMNKNMKYEIWKYDDHEQKYEIWNINTKMLLHKFIVVA